MDGILNRWWNALKGRESNTRKTRVRSTPPRRTRLDFDRLEERWTPTTYNVINTNPTGAGSFLAAITAAKTDPAGPSIIDMNAVAGQTITLPAIGTEILFDAGNTTNLGITVNGFGATVSAGSAYRVFNVNRAGLNLTINNMSVSNGTAIGSGGAIVVQQGTLNLNTATVSASTAFVGNGGGIALTGGTLNLTDVNINNNNVTLGNGGGISQSGGQLNLNNVTFNANNVNNGNGGGMNITGGGLSFSGLTFTNNTTTGDGGGLHIANGTYTLAFSAASTGNNAANGGLLAVENGTYTINPGSVLAGNSANNGGAISVGIDATLNLNESTVRNNTASSNGGGIVLRDLTSTLNVNSSVVGGLAGSGNSANNGGGIHSVGTINLNRATIANNSATSNGAGVQQNLGQISIVNSTISSNTGSGGLRIVGGTAGFTNSTVASNATYGLLNVGALITSVNSIFANNGTQDVAGAVASNGNNLISNAAGSAGFGVPGDIVNQAALLSPLAANGAVAFPSFTHALQSGLSPAYNAGSNLAATNAGLTTDQRGSTRFVGVVDIGAYELLDTIAPTASVTTAPANVDGAQAGLNSRTIVVTFTDPTGTGFQAPSGVNPATFGANDLTINNGAFVSGFSISGNQVTYTIQSPGANWGSSFQGTYTISIAAGSVLDRAGNGIAGVANFSSFIVDTQPPTVTLTTPPALINSNSSPTAPNTFTVTFTDLVSGINAATIDVGDFVVTNGAIVAPITSIIVMSTPTTAVVTYSISPPTGNWTTSPQGTYTIALVNGTVADNFGNAVAGNANFASFNVNTIRPFATITTQPNNINVANQAPGTNTFTITYTTLGAPLNPATYGTDDVTISNGATILPIISVVNNMNAVTYTVQAPTPPGMWSSPPQGLYTIALNPDAVFDLAGNSVAANPTMGFFTVDVYRPVATLTTPPVTINAAYAGPPTNTFTITYAEPPVPTQSGLNTTTFGVGNVTVTNGMTSLTVASAVVSGNSVTYTVNAPGGNWATAPTGTYTIAIVANNVQDLAGNGILGNASFASFGVDLTPPTATLATPPATIFAGAATNNNFTVNYTETGSGLNLATINNTNFTATNGVTTATVSVVSITPTGTGATVVYTVNAPGGTWGASTQGTYTVALNANTVADNFGNVVAGNPNFASFLVNTAPPQANLTTPPNNISIANVAPGTNSFTITYTPSGAPLNPATFGPSDVTVQNGATTLTVLSAIAAGNAVTYTVQAPGGMWTNLPQGQYTIALNANSVFDTAGNAVVANPTLGFFVVDTYRPIAAMTTPPATINTNYVGPQSNTFTITYDEPAFPTQSGVNPATFGVGNITVTNGMTVLTVQTAMVAGNAVTYTVLAPGGNWSTAPAGTYTIALVGDSVRDNVGNGILANPNFAFFVVDLTRPTATLTTPPANINIANSGPGTNTLTITYEDTGSGLNPASFDVTDITVSMGMTTLPVTSIATMGNVVTYTIAPVGGWAAVPGGTYTVALNANSVLDFAGNGVLGNASLATFTVDVVAPVPTVTPDGIVTADSPIIFTINFSEPVTGLTTAGFSITNGTAGTLTAVNASQYTLPVTPLADGIVTVTVNAGAAQDAAGNPSVVSNTASVESDRTGPIPTFSLPSTLNTVSGPVTYTITWTDPNFDVATLTAGQVILNTTGTAGATVASVAITGNTALVTLVDVFGNGTISLSLPAGTAVDTVGNLAPAAGPSTSFSVTGNRVLSVSQPPAPATILPGSTYVYAINYANVGNQIAPDARLVVNVPTAFGLFVPASSTPGWVNTGGNQYQLSLGNLAIGASGQATFAVNYAANTPAGTNAVFTATLTDRLGDGAASSTVSFLIVDPNRARWGRCCK